MKLKFLFREEYWEALGYVIGLNLLWVVFGYSNPLTPSLCFWRDRLKKIIKGEV